VPAGIGVAGNNWFQAMPQAGGDYLVGYNFIERRLTGAIGTNGLEPDVAVPQARFAQPMRYYNRRLASVSVAVGTIEDGYSVELISGGKTLYQLMGNYKLKVLMNTSSPIEELGQAVSVDKNGEGKTVITSYPMVVTDNEVLILSSIGTGEEPAVRVRYEHPGMDAYVVEAARLSLNGGYLLRLTPELSRTDPRWQPAMAVYFSADGVKQREIQLPEIVREWEPGNRVEQYVVSLVIPPAMGALTLIPRYFSAPPTPQERAEWNQGVALCCSAAVVMAGLAFWLARRRGMEPRAVWVWTILTLLLGALGLVLMLSLRGLPVVTRCRLCGRQKRVDEPVCPHCGARVAGPEANGTEVMVPLTT